MPVAIRRTETELEIVMRHRSRLLALLAPIVVLALAAAGPAAAQGGSPTPTAPTPAECTPPQRPAAFFERLVGTPGVAAAASPAATPAVFAAPAGTPADQATVDGVTLTIRTFFACTNAGDPLRGFSLFSDAYLTRSILESGGVPDMGMVTAISTPSGPPPADEQDVLLSVDDVRVLADGRVGAFITDAQGTDYIVFVKGPSGWLIDDETFKVKR